MIFFQLTWTSLLHAEQQQSLSHIKFTLNKTSQKYEVNLLLIKTIF